MHPVLCNKTRARQASPLRREIMADMESAHTNICEGGNFVIQKINVQGRKIQLLTVPGIVYYYLSMTNDEKRRITLAVAEIFNQRDFDIFRTVK